MTYNRNSKFNTFYSDMIVITFSLLGSVFTSTVVLISSSGSREEGMGYGVVAGFFLALCVFYYFRAKFTFPWTAAQLIVNGSFSVGEFLGVTFLVQDTGIQKISYGYVIIFLFIPALIAFNKQILDYLASKLGAETRTKKPAEIL